MNEGVIKDVGAHPNVFKEITDRINRQYRDEHGLLTVLTSNMQDLVCGIGSA